MTIFLGSVIMNQNETHSFTGNLFLPASPVYSVSLLRLSDRKLKITPIWTLQNKSVLERLWDNFNAWLPYNDKNNSEFKMMKIMGMRIPCSQTWWRTFWEIPFEINRWSESMKLHAASGVSHCLRCCAIFGLLWQQHYFDICVWNVNK